MKKKGSPLLRDLRENRTKWLMLVPAAVVVILMCYIPMSGIVLAFKAYNYHDGIFGSPWVGLENFRYFFQSGKAWTTTRNTVLYNIAFLCVNTFLQIVCAVLLSELAGKYFKRITQSVMFLPYFISWVVVGAFIYNMFNFEFGAVNSFLRSVGLAPVDVYSNKNAWPVILIVVSAFKNVGYGTVMYLASIVNIDGQLFEAADLDGATMWQKIWHITLPGVKGTIVILFIMQIGKMMSVGSEKILLLYNPSTYSTADVISTYVDRKGLLDQDYSYSTAVNLFNSVINFVLVFLANTLSRKLTETSLF